MKKFLILGALLTTCLVAGCVGEVKTYTDSGQTISIGTNQEFVIALGSNPTTGYRWQVSHDKTVLELLRSEYQTGEAAKQGAGGIELFRFKALKTGATRITMSHKRQWEEQPIEQKVFSVDIM